MKRPASCAAWLPRVAILGAAAVVHWGLRRLGRRLPRLLARHFSGDESLHATAAWEGTVELALLVPKLALWLGATVYVTDQFMSLQESRDMLVHVLTMSVNAPIFSLNDRAYSGLDVVELPLILAGLCLAIGALTRVLRSQVLQWTGIERGTQEAVALLTRYALTFLAIIVVLQVWGIDARSLTIVASVLGVGIGFGLQSIANNFVSGLVVSLERPIQPGDFVKVGEWMGTVERIGPRNTEVRTLDNVSILVPNSRFLETEVINWSHGDPVCRLHIPVGVAYESDVPRVRAALLEAASGHPDVLANPRPRVEFRSFGDSALSFELLVWTREPRTQFRLSSDLNFRIEAVLRRHSIRIPYPQQDLHVRSPGLDKLVEAWMQHHFTEDELARANGRGAMAGPLNASQSDAHDFEDDLGPRTWTSEQFHGLAQRMRGAGGVSIADRRHLLTVYRSCFVGREAVDWMMRNLALTREEAILAGQLLIDHGAVRHVLDEHTFKNGHFFYRFREDVPMPVAVGTAMAAEKRAS